MSDGHIAVAVATIFLLLFHWVPSPSVHYLVHCIRNGWCNIRLVRQYLV